MSCARLALVPLSFARPYGIQKKISDWMVINGFLAYLIVGNGCLFPIKRSDREIPG